MQHKAFSKILPLIILVIVVGGGYSAWKYWQAQEEISPSVITESEPQILSLEIIPSQQSGEGIVYQKGAKAIVIGKNLERVEIRQRGGGQIYTSTEGGLIGTGVRAEVNNGEEKWEISSLPTERLSKEFCAVGFDSNDNKAGEICLYNVYGEKEFVCGIDTVKDAYENIYGTIYSKGRCWLDRNLGALRVATAYDDTAVQGYFFQWGRSADGHQVYTSNMTTNLSNFDNPGHDDFIYGMGSPFDWRSPQNNNLWQGVDSINNPCPNGWRVPTEAEWNIERSGWVSANRIGAYASPLKLTVAGLRSALDGTVGMAGISGYYWSNTVNGTEAKGLWITVGGAKMGSHSRNLGLSVRCIKQ